MFRHRLRHGAPVLALVSATALVPVLAIPATAVPAGAPVVAAAAPAAQGTPYLGADISWPNCPKGMGIPSRRSEGNPMPDRTARFVLVGLTNGPAFTPNPCLKKQVDWVRSRHVWAAPYAVVTYPTAAQLTRYGRTGPYRPTSTTARLRNVGWAQARTNLVRMKAAGLRSPMVWMDVEHYPVRPWSSSRSRNKAVVDGVLAGYRDAGMRVGVYSTRLQWIAIVGTGANYGLPEWRTAGQTSLSAARRMCSVASIQGGRAVVAQWWTRRTDHDVLCSGEGRVARMRQHFRKY
ncbi:hypothetical protein KMZ32_07135 [Phycicoccus sp. MAQZ13P-2]|uniref:hypothetical protein n=1 Tax=Phycicoccus mangrovi TaxID=2840470 RepID=UPI001C0072E8|nr:hypothetical protein [Phycicoccus mangrovi]MBT9256143.1 hypothetical protein [Phycicoccus mangrovi]MBT9273842.1 hypothetical protein [Phycicoccus mangrovi]